MQDRLTPTPGRVLITPESGEPYYAVVSMADNPSVEGSDYNKANVQPDEVCDLYGVDRVTSEPKDLFLAVPALMGKAILTVNVLKPNSTAFPNLVVDGLGLDSALTTTNASGTFTVLVDAGTYTLTSTALNATFDTAFPSTAVTIAKGERKTVTITTTSNGAGNKRSITASSTVKFSSLVSDIDIFCVGGGGAAYYSGDGGGGGGGYTTTMLSVVPPINTDISAIVGAGGVVNVTAGFAGTTSFLTATATGGYSGYQKDGDTYGGRGGSGGGDTGFTGGTNGANGGGTYGGNGQGTTTKEFGESTGTLYSTGGDGNGASSKTSGAANTGNGGSCSNSTAYAGGSGIIVVRWRYA